MSGEAQWPSHGAPSVGTQLTECALMLQISHHPMGNSRSARCLQGGGVHVAGGTVAISSCTINGNTAGYGANGGVRTHVKISHRPVGKLLTCFPRLTLAQLRPTLWSTTECKCRRDLKFSHRPHGRIADSLASTLQKLQSPRWENG
jgi:hypothetical protein